MKEKARGVGIDREIGYSRSIVKSSLGNRWSVSIEVKFFFKKNHILNIKYRLITKLISKVRVKFIKTNYLSLAHIYCSNLVSNHDLIRLIRFVS